MEDSFYSAAHWGFDEIHSSDSDDSEKQSTLDSDNERDSRKKRRREEKLIKKASSKDHKRKDGKKKKEKRHKKPKKHRRETTRPSKSAEACAKSFDLLLRAGECTLEELAEHLRGATRAAARSEVANDDARAAADILGETFHFAASAGDLDGVQLLLREGGVPVDWRSTTDDSGGLTALHTACLLCDGPLATLLVKHGADCDLETSSGERAKDMGLDYLLTGYANEVAAWEAKKRAEEREKREAQELARERALAEAEWKAKIAEASAYDELDRSGAGPALENGWDAEEQAVRDAEDRHGDWFAQIANQRRQLRRAAQAAFQQQQQQQQERSRTQPKKSTTSDTKGPQARGPSDEFAGFRSGSAGATPPPPSHAAPPQAPSPTLSSGEAQAARARDSAAWKKFAETASGSSEVLIGEKQVPWPCQGDNVPLPGHQDMEPQARKVAVRQLQLRWHVDKFTQKFGRHLSNVSNQNEATLRRVVAISQALNAIIDKNLKAN